MRGRRFATEADVDRHISNGFGQGVGASYVPWLRVQDVPSQGHSRKVQGIKVDRLHHLLSNLEYGYFLVCEFSEDVVDIREQYPLLPRGSAQALASAMGLKYPKYPKTSVPYVMTTDFLLTVKKPDGSSGIVARTVKYERDLVGEGAVRTREKLEIEKEFWNAQGVDWTIVTEAGFTVELVQNLGLLRKFAQIPRALTQPTVVTDFLLSLRGFQGYPWTTAQVLKKVATKLFISYQDSRALYHYLIWHKRIKLDLIRAPLQMGLPLPELLIVEDTSPYRKTAEGAL